MRKFILAAAIAGVALPIAATPADARRNALRSGSAPDRSAPRRIMPVRSTRCRKRKTATPATPLATGAR